MNIILFGFRGCGKSYLGKLLSEKIMRPFIDTDELIVQLHAQETGETLTVRAIYRSLGSAYFRSLETKAIQSLANVEKSVIALGGGAVLDPQNREMLNKIGKLVYVEASLDVIKNRGTLPLENSLEELYLQSLPIYRSIEAFCVKDLDEKKAIADICKNLGVHMGVHHGI